MNSLYFLLFFEFFKIGLFTYGGGYASLPFLYALVDKYDWFCHDELSQIIAISGLTPGPVGLNMATFCGFKILNVPGAVLSSFALVVPMLITVSIVFRLYREFGENKFVKSILYVLRPTSCALIVSVGLKLVYNLIIAPHNYTGLFIIFILFLMTFKFSRNPAVYIFAAAIMGVLNWCFNFACGFN